MLHRSTQRQWPKEDLQVLTRMEDVSLVVIRTTEDAGALVSDEDEGALEPSG